MAKTGEEIFKQFDEFRKRLFESQATDEEKATLWKAFLNIFTGTE